MDTSVIAAKGGKALFQSAKQPQAPGADFQPGVPPNLQVGDCPYCLDKGVHVVDIGCSHLFCTKCCSNLVKITKIKKGLNLSKLEGSLGPGQSQGLQVIKCPKCSLINMLSGSKMEEILSVTDYDRAKREKHETIMSKGEIKCMLCTTKKVQVA